MLRLLPPVAYRTGVLHAQPQAAETRAGYFFDADLNYLAPYCLGALDAPASLPSGGMRAIECETVAVGVAGVTRPGAWNSPAPSSAPRRRIAGPPTADRPGGQR